MDEDVAIEVELHEAEVWPLLVEATGRVPGDPLAARVDRSVSVPLPALTSLDDGLFNRVIGLGVGEETSDDEIKRVLAWYASQEQRNVWVEVSPVARPRDLPALLEEQGFVDTEYRQAKLWREPTPLPERSGPEVVELTAEDRGEVAAVHLATSGVPDVIAPWFGATVGAEGFRHFGVRVEGRLVSTAGMYVSDGVAWLGFGATLPEQRGRGMQLATLTRRINEAVDLGCTLLHAEAPAVSTDPSLVNMLRVGFVRLYDKALYAAHQS